MLMELHSHTAERSGCSMIGVRTLIEEAVEKGLDGLVLTDHHHLWSPAELERVRRRLVVPSAFVLLSGQEVTTIDHGDILVYGALHRIPSGITLRELRRQFPDAALVWAHPFRWGGSPSDQELTDPLLDAVEVVNGNQTLHENMQGIATWERLRFTATSGSDCPSTGRAGLFPTRLRRPVRSVEELVAAIRGGECSPTGCTPSEPC